MHAEAQNGRDQPPVAGPCPTVSLAAGLLAIAAAAILAVLAAVAAPAVAHAASGARRSAGAPASPHTVNVTFKGPVALVEVTRLLEARAAGRETLFDVALPPRSALLEVEIGAKGRWTRARPAESAKALESYLSSVRTRGLTATAEPFEDGATHRIRVLAAPDEGRQVQVGDGGPPAVRYRFTTLVESSGGRYRIRFPPAPEASPIGADVTVILAAPTGATIADVDIAGARTSPLRGARRLSAAGHSSERTGWDVSYALVPAAAGAGGPAAGGAGAVLDAVAAIATVPGSRESAVVVAVRTGSVATAAVPLPERVLFVVDRSRSVGLPGLAAERDVARRLLERLPPVTQFDALFFDRHTTRLFTSVRAATLEAMTALDEAMVPGQLANGSDLEAALRAAGDLLRRERGSFAPRAALVVITDGAIPDDQTGAALGAALGPTPGVDLEVVALSVRPAEDEPAPSRARKAMRALPEARGGVEAEVRSDHLEEAVTAILDSLKRGGDLFSLRLAAGNDSVHLAGSLPPGSGAAGAFRLSGRGAGLELRANAAGETLRTVVRPLPVDAAWLLPHLTQPGGGPAQSETRLGASPLAVLLVEPVVQDGPAARAGGPRGSMDRIVVQNTLSLAFMPRARACYQNRPMASPRTRELSGRVRLEIDLVRGEVSNAGLQVSTLNNPEIETCLREAAFAIEVPRAYRNDAPTTAIVNLVFQPRSAEKQRRLDEDSPVGPEIDLILEQLPPELDMADILLTAPPPAHPPVAPPAPQPAAPRKPPVPQKFD